MRYAKEVAYGSTSRYPEPFTTIITGFQEANVLLESTYCYPRGGGQPGDTGTMVAGDNEHQLVKSYQVR